MRVRRVERRGSACLVFTWIAPERMGERRVVRFDVIVRRLEVMLERIFNSLPISSTFSPLLIKSRIAAISSPYPANNSFNSSIFPFEAKSAAFIIRFSISA